jgi:phosphoribosyl 1,2-cyclic phosphodiesterase
MPETMLGSLVPRNPEASSAPRVTLWGARGSIPTPGPQTARHGGNTSCLSVEVGESCFVFDAGSGIRDLGEYLLTTSIRRIHLILTHTHWDHLLGFPFFAPIYRAGVHLTLGLPGVSATEIERRFRILHDAAFFPVPLEGLAATISFASLAGSEVAFSEARCRWTPVEHPGGALALRLDHGSGSVVWVPDHEVFKGRLGPATLESLPRDEVASLRPLLDLLRGADLVLHEAQYTEAEYPSRVGFGHSSLPNACALMTLAEVKRWVVIHHDPGHHDDLLDDKLQVTRAMLRDLGHSGVVEHGFDGWTHRWTERV